MRKAKTHDTASLILEQRVKALELRLVMAEQLIELLGTQLDERYVLTGPYVPIPPYIPTCWPNPLPTNMPFVTYTISTT
jgi:hypothetical protein